MANYVVIILLVFSPLISQPTANAQAMKPDKQSLEMIADFAERICSEVPLEGGSSNLELSGSAETKLNGLLKSLGSLGIEGAAKYEQKEFKGLLQKDLRAAIQDQNMCRLKVAESLISKILDRSDAAPRQAPPVGRFPMDMQLASAKKRIKYLAEDYLHTNTLSLADVMGPYGDNIMADTQLYDWPKVMDALEKEGYVKIGKRTKNNIEFTYTGRAASPAGKESHPR